MIFHENRLLADDSYENHTLFFSKIGKDVSKFVVCCSCDWLNKVKISIILECKIVNIFLSNAFELAFVLGCCKEPSIRWFF